jgi:ABC-2 type transport system permease protein
VTLTGPGDAHIADRGYRRYQGERLGARGAQRALYLASLQRALGLRRKARYKIVPVLVAIMAYLPAAVFVGASAIVPEQIAEGLQVDYGGYYGFITAAILLFVAATVPDVLCADRRTGMLGLYLAAPLTRDSYLAVKAAAVTTVIGIVTVGPPLLLLIGYSLVEAGPSWPTEGATLLLRIVVAGLVVAVWYTALAMAVCSLTDRRGLASAGIALGAIGSAAVVSALVGGAELSVWLRVLDLFNLPFELVYRVYGEPGNEPELTTLPLALAYLAWVVGAGVLVRTAYQRLTVTK